MTTLNSIKKEIESNFRVVTRESEEANWFTQLNNYGIKVHSTTHLSVIKQRKANNIPNLSQDLTDEAVLLFMPSEIDRMLYYTGLIHTQKEYEAKKLWERTGYSSKTGDTPILIHPPVESHGITIETDHMTDLLVERIGFNFILLPVVPQMNTSSPGDEYTVSTFKTKRNNADLRYMPACLYWIESDGKVIYGLGTHMHELVSTYQENEFALANSHGKALFYRYDIRIPYDTPLTKTTDLPWLREED